MISTGEVKKRKRTRRLPGRDPWQARSFKYS